MTAPTIGLMFRALLSLGVLALLGAAAPVNRPRTRAAELVAKAGAETDDGDYAAAIRHASEAAALFAQAGDHAGRSLAVNRIGLAHLYAGEYREALPQFETAIAEATAARDDSARAEATSNLANVYFFLGRYSEAEAGYEAALKIVTAHLGEAWAPRRRTLLLVNLATLDQKLGRDQQALERYREVQKTSADVRPSERAQILTNLGVLYRRLGDPIKALKAYDDARALFAQEHHVDGELGVMKNRGIVLALDLKQLDAARANFSEALARATQASNRREMLQARLYRGETAFRLHDLPAAREDFEAALAAARELKTPEEEWKSLFGIARVDLQSGAPAQAVASLERAIEVIEGIREAIRIPTLRFDYFADKREVYDALIALELEGNHTARAFELMERSRSRVWRERLGLTATPSLAAVQRALPDGALLLETWRAKDGSAVLLVTRGSVSVRRAQVETSELESLNEELSRGPSRETARAAAKLAVALLPANIAEDTRQIIVVPDGPLALVPFEILPIEERMLIEIAPVSYVPSAAMLLRAPAARRQSDVVLRAFANASLPAAAREVRDIASQLGGRSVLYIGAEDRKQRLYDADGAPLLHIASHAFADGTAMERSRIEFAPRPGSSEPDWLFLKEAYDLPLKNVELAVLSACETERGRMVAGEGVQSFGRALLAAGARSTVTTLWRVPDEATAAFMKQFYRHLQRGESRAEALRQAKLHFASKDPHYWAAFVLTGEASTPIPRVKKAQPFAIAVGVVVLLAAGAAIFAVRRRKRPHASH